MGEFVKLVDGIDLEIDVIFVVYNYKVVNGEVNGKLIVQVFEYGKVIGIVDFEFDKKLKDIVKKLVEI